MIKKTSIYILILVFNCLCLTSQAETKLANDTIQSNGLNSDELPKLNMIIELALKNSPLLQSTDIEVKKISEQIKIDKKSWLDYIQIEGNVRYGLFNQLTISDQFAGNQTEVALQSAKEQFNYYGGLTLKLPLSQLVNTKSRIKIQKFNIQETEYKKASLKKEITQIIIEEYYKLMGIEESLNSSQELLQTMNIAYMKAVKEIETGIMGMSEFSVLISSKDKAFQGYSKLKNDYFMQLLKLKLLMGENLNIDQK